MSTLSLSLAAWLRDELNVVGRAFMNGLHRVEEQRQEDADRFVRPYLAKLPEEELAEMGYSSGEVAKIKASRKASLPYYI